MAQRAFKLDLKDKKILYELDNNARQSCFEIAKKVGLSKESVNYRIKRLEKEGIISGYLLVVNLAQLKIVQFKICLTLQHIDSEQLSKIVSKLVSHPSVKWVVSCKGNWDMIISLETDSLEGVNILKEQVLGFFGSHVHEKAISILISATTYPRNFFINAPSAMKKSKIILKKGPFVEVDETDLSILRILGANARIPLVEIAEKLKVSSRIVQYRIKQLEKTKVILGYKISLNYGKTGIKFYKTFIHLDSLTSERTKSLSDYLDAHPNVIHNVSVLSNWDIEPEFEVYSDEEFDKHIKELRDKFSDIIQNIEVVTISKEYKLSYF